MLAVLAFAVSVDVEQVVHTLDDLRPRPGASVPSGGSDAADLVRRV